MGPGDQEGWMGFFFLPGLLGSGWWLLWPPTAPLPAPPCPFLSLTSMAWESQSGGNIARETQPCEDSRLLRCSGHPSLEIMGP